jgi:3-methyl-2-oxobutanoate hydroxymethyltransferase
VTIAELHAMKREGRKIAAVVCWDANTAAVADAAGVEIVSVGDSAAASLDELLAFCASVRRGVEGALVSCDLPEPSVEGARRLVALGADLVKVEGVDAVRELVAAGIAVFAQIESAEEARAMEAAGAALIDFRHSGPEDGEAAVKAVSIPVVGGLGGGPWLDGRVRAAHKLLEIDAFLADVRGSRPVRGD